MPKDGSMDEDRTTVPLPSGEYEGLPGRTRQIVAHHACAACGFLFGARVYAAINVATDPALRVRLSDGDLNILTCPACGASGAPALPLVYHDPGAQRLVLLLPDAMRHRELESRATLLEELAADAAHVPDYVRRAEVLFGAAGLVQVLQESGSRVEDRGRGDDTHVGVRQALEEKEAELQQREEVVTAREEDLQAKHEDLVVAMAKVERGQADLAGQRADLEREREALRALAVDLEARDRTIHERSSKEITDAPVPAVERDAVQQGLASFEGRPSDAVNRFRAGDHHVAHVLHDGCAFLFARPGAERLGALVRAEPAVRVQLFELSGSPVVTLVVLPAGAPSEERAGLGLFWTLDPADPEDGRFLRLLADDFQLQLDLYDDESRAVATWRIRAPLEENVKVILARADRVLARTDSSRVRFDVAARAYHDLGEDRLGRKRHNFSSDSFRDFASPAAARLALGIVTYWSDPENEDYLILVKSLPLTLWTSIRERVIRHALDFGIRLSPALVEIALERKLASSPEELLRSAVSSFAEVSLRIRPSDLDPAQEWENWTLLLADCLRARVEVDPEIENLAAAAAKRAGAALDEAAPGGDLTLLPEAALLGLLSDRDQRRDAALELCERGAADSLEPVFGAVCNMSRAEVARVLPAMVGFGPQAVPHLVQGLRHRKSFVRQGCALALGAMKAEAGIDPLVEVLLTEPSHVWREAARALGDMGRPSHPKVVSALMGADVEGRERIAWALSQSALDVRRRAEVEAMSGGRDPRLARAASRALELLDQVRRTDQEVRGNRPLSEHTIVRSFSRQFYEAMSPEVRELGEGDIVEQEEVLDDRDIVDEAVEVQDDDILGRQ
jgi:HEAT repeat protein